MKEKDPAIKKVFDKAVAWAVFPRIRKAGIGIGGAGGNGRVYQRGKFVGTTTVTQVSVGFQLGAQVYGEIIFFQDEYTFEKFKNGKFELGANISAVVFDVGAAETAGFKDGTLVFVIPDAGLMYEATVSGQKFTFKAAKK
jgi:lipid-binding SYLF domain-containing protein